MIASLIIGGGGDDSDLDTVDVPEELSEDDVGAQPSSILSVGSLPPGEYRTTALGTPLTFSTEFELGASPRTTGVFQLSSSDSQSFGGRSFNLQGLTDQTLTIQRVAALPSPDDLTQTSATFDWPTQDIDGWLASLEARVLLEGPTALTVGGRDAIRFEIQVSAFGCGLSVGCPRVLPSDNVADLDLFREGVRHRVWIVDQGDEYPIVLSAAIEGEEDLVWFDQAEELVASFEFGEVGPSPVRAVDPGRFELDAFGGIALTVDDAVTLAESDGRLTFVNSVESEVSLAFLTSPLTLDGDRIFTIDELTPLFDAQVWELEERSSTVVDEVVIRSFVIDTGGFTQPILLLDENEVGLSGAGWPPAGVWWVIEDPNLGLLIVQGVINDLEMPLDQDVAYIDALLETLEFRDVE